VIKKGKYRTLSGNEALVVRVGFLCYGAIIIENVYYIHLWSIFGGSKSGEPRHNLET
jgi:hypothetical protein